MENKLTINLHTCLSQSVASMDKIFHIAGIGFLSLFLPAYAESQNAVNVHVQSIPSLENAYSGITLTAIPGPMFVHTETDSITGNGTLNIPTGTYELMIKTSGHKRYIDTLTINSNQDLDIQNEKKPNCASSSCTI